MVRSVALLLLIVLVLSAAHVFGEADGVVDATLISPREGESSPPMDGVPVGSRPEAFVALKPAWEPIPLSALSPDAQSLVVDLVSQSVFSHRVRGLTYKSRRGVFDFLIEHPEFAVEVARVLRVGEYKLVRTSEGYWGDDLRGATGSIRILYADENTRLFYLEGGYSPTLLPTIKGRILLLTETKHTTGLDGESYAQTEITGYLALDNPITELLAKITRPIAEAAVEKKVKRLFKTISRVSGEAYDDPEALYRKLKEDGGVNTETLERFRQVLLAHRLPSWADGERFHLIPEAELKSLH